MSVYFGQTFKSADALQGMAAGLRARARKGHEFSAFDNNQISSASQGRTGMPWLDG